MRNYCAELRWNIPRESVLTVEVIRYDVGQVRGVIDLPNGGVRVQSSLARSGVYEYSDGQRTWREYLPPEEAFAQDSLDSLRGATVTDLHPPELIGPANWRQLAMGHVGDDVRRDGDLVTGALTVNDSTLVQRIKSKERRETSCGYKCTVELTPGVTPNGEHYDGIQRHRRYNHVGLGPDGWGRAGPRVSLRLDGVAYQVSSERATTTTETRADSSAEKPRMPTFAYKGKQYKTDSAEDMAAAEKDVGSSEAELKTHIEQLSKQVADLMTTVATLGAKLKMQEAAAAAAATPPPEDDVVAADARAEERITLKKQAAEVLGDQVKLDGLSSDAIRKAVVTKMMPPEYRLDGISGDTLVKMYEGIMSVRATQKARRNDALESVITGLELPDLRAGGGTTRTDASGAGAHPDPQVRMIQRSVERWKLPLSHTASKG